MQIEDTYFASVDVFMVAAMHLDGPLEGTCGLLNSLGEIIYDLSEWGKSMHPAWLLFEQNRLAFHSHASPLPWLLPCPSTGKDSAFMSGLRAALDNAFKAASNGSLRVDYVVAHDIGNYFSVDIRVFAFNKTQESLIEEVWCWGFGSLHYFKQPDPTCWLAPKQRCRLHASQLRPALLSTMHPPASSNTQVNHVLSTEPNLSSYNVTAGLNGALLNYKNGLLSVAKLSNLQVR